MKRILGIILISIFIILNMAIQVNAESAEMSKLRFHVINADENYKIYMLLPKKYIMYAIQHDNLDIGYDGANTLIYNNIPSIIVDIDKVQKDTYIEDNIEYVQIELDNLGDDEYLFEIISEYTDMDMRYRVTSESKDNIIIIDRFTMKNNKCEIEYNYEAETVKSIEETHTKIKFNLNIWQVIAIILIVIVIAYFLNRRG